LASGRFEIDIRPYAIAALDALRAFERGTIIDAIESMLRHDPLKVTRNRKPLFGVAANFEYVPPMWELKVGQYRMFYDVNEEMRVVYVRAVRFKPPHRMTQEILT
jgi:mRNA-degrading endonuclease RelE of RelBE toxin-antitoxin system